jgi:probable addiction module antidote protein
MKIKTTKKWDVVEYLKTEEDMAAYLEAALEENDPTLVAAALGDIARAKGITHNPPQDTHNLLQLRASHEL